MWPISELTDYKLHFARWNQIQQPLDVWARDKAEWQTWHEYLPARDDFNRRYIFTVMQFYHETDAWLFGGVYEVLDRRSDGYRVALTDQGEGFIGRLKLLSDYRNRSTRVNFENQYSEFRVQEVLREPYSGRAFPGYEAIDLSFEELGKLCTGVTE
jgi:hypothetical protein